MSGGLCPQAAQGRKAEAICLKGNARHHLSLFPVERPDGSTGPWQGGREGRGLPRANLKCLVRWRHKGASPSSASRTAMSPGLQKHPRAVPYPDRGVGTVHGDALRQPPLEAAGPAGRGEDQHPPDAHHHGHPHSPLPDQRVRLLPGHQPLQGSEGLQHRQREFPWEVAANRAPPRPPQTTPESPRGVLCSRTSSCQLWQSCGAVSAAPSTVQ